MLLRLCLLSHQCDVLFHQAGSYKRCDIYPSISFKNLQAHELMEERPHWWSYKSAAYILQCTTSQEDVVINGDLYSNTQDGWDVSNTCSDIVRSENHNHASWTKPAFNGLKQYGVYVECMAGEEYNATQILETLPAGMDLEYLKTVKPQGYFRSWFFCEDSASGETFDLGIELQFLNAGSEVVGQSIGGINTYDEGASYDDTYVEIFYPIFDLHSFDFDSIQVRQTLKNIQVSSKHHLSPVEFIVDIPQDMGCFEMLSDPSSLGFTITEATDEMSPAWCVTKCLKSDSKKRLAFLKNGQECSCFETFPYEHVALPPSHSENKLCDKVCSGAPSEVCGGANTYSVYISTCPENQVRFGPHCYFELSTPFQSIFDNGNQCEDEESLLWYPETEAEIKFISQKFPVATAGDVYHLGFAYAHKEKGFRGLDNNTFPGIPVYTSKNTTPMIRL